MSEDKDMKKALWERDKIHLETLRGIIFARYNIIPTIAMLAAAILIIASFNQDIILEEDDLIVKIVLIVLLLIIPISLIDYSIKLSRDEDVVLKKLGSYPDKKTFFRKIKDGSPYIYVTIVAAVILVIIYLIIKNF